MVEALECCWESLDLQSFGVESSSELPGKEPSAQDLLVLLGLTRGWSVGSCIAEPTFNLTDASSLAARTIPGPPSHQTLFPRDLSGLRKEII